MKIYWQKTPMSAIIPHAGKDFAGSARAAVFKIFQKDLSCEKKTGKDKSIPLLFI